MRSTISSEAHRISFARYKDTLYNNFIDALIANNSIEEALYYSESARSRAFVDLLGSKRGIVFKNQETTEYINEQRNVQISSDFMRKQTGISDNQGTYMNELQSSLDTKFSGNKELLSLITVSNLEISEIQAIPAKGV